MNDDRRTRWLVKVPAIVLLVAAVAVAFLGVTQIPYGLSDTGSGFGTVAFGAVLICGAAGGVWVAWSLWRSKGWAIHAALALMVGMVAVSVWVARTALNPLGTAMNPKTGKLEPVYDSLALDIAFAVVPIVIALACLVVAELRSRRVGGQR